MKVCMWCQFRCFRLPLCGRCLNYFRGIYQWGMRMIENLHPQTQECER